MGTFIVTYDLNNEVRRPPILDEIKKTDGWAMLSESSYAIYTSETVSEVYSRFEPMIDDDDSFYVITLRRPYTGRGYVKVNDWLEKHLT